MIQTIKLYDIELTCEYSYSFSEGIPNVYPDSEELIIEKIHTEGDITLLLDSHSRTITIYADIKEKLLEYARDNYRN